MTHPSLRPAFLLPIVAGLLSVAIVPPAGADVTLHLTTNGAPQTIYATADRMCMKGDDGTMVFDAKNGVIRMQGPDGESHEMTKEQLEQMADFAKQAGDMGDAMAQYEDMMAEARQQALDSIKDLPEEHRKMAEQQIYQQFGAPDEPSMLAKRVYEPMGEKKKINGFHCKGYSIRQGDKTVGEVWTASLDEVGLSEKDIQVVGKMREFFSVGFEGAPFLEEALSEFEMLDPASEAFLGLPVRTVERSSGEEDVTELVSVDKGKIDSGVFEAGP